MRKTFFWSGKQKTVKAIQQARPSIATVEKAPLLYKMKRIKEKWNI